MSLGYFVRDVEAKPQSLLIRLIRSAYKWFENVSKDRGRNLRARIFNGELEPTVHGHCVVTDWLLGGTVRDGIPKKVRNKLTNPPVITFDRLGQREIGLNNMLRCGCLQFSYQVPEERFEQESAALRLTFNPPPRRSRAKSMILVMRSSMRTVLFSIIPTIMVARSFSGVLRSRETPLLIAAIGLRKSWPSTAINCSRSAEVDLLERGLAIRSCSC